MVLALGEFLLRQLFQARCRLTDSVALSVYYGGFSCRPPGVYPFLRFYIHRGDPSHGLSLRAGPDRTLPNIWTTPHLKRASNSLVRALPARSYTACRIPDESPILMDKEYWRCEPIRARQARGGS